MRFTKRMVAVLLVAALAAGLYAGSFIDWDSEDDLDAGGDLPF